VGEVSKLESGIGTRELGGYTGNFMVVEFMQMSILTLISPRPAVHGIGPSNLSTASGIWGGRNN
jgi:hypothetical protein